MGVGREKEKSTDIPTKRVNVSPLEGFVWQGEEEEEQGRSTFQGHSMLVVRPSHNNLDERC